MSVGVLTANWQECTDTSFWPPMIATLTYSTYIVRVHEAHVNVNVNGVLRVVI